MGKQYVGIRRADYRYERFTYSITPTLETHGSVYMAVIGPFRSKRGATFMAEHGSGNPHLQTVSEAERIAKANAKGGAR